MVGPLKRVLVCSPEVAGWRSPADRSRWQELGYLHAPCDESALREHAQLRNELEAAGAEVVLLENTEGATLDAVYVHDPSIVTDAGAVCLRMGKTARETEPGAHRAFYQAMGAVVLGEIEPPGTAEGGDLVWLDPGTLLAGRSYRTNRQGIEQLQSLLLPFGVEVLAAPLPHGSGPDTCLHLMSILSMLDERTALVDLPMLAVETVDLLRERGLRFVEIEPAERTTLACNVLSLGNGRLLAMEQNTETNRRLSRLQYDVRTFSGIEIGVNGGGGPTCLTRPLLRT